jgi:hypothetical protein
MTPSEIRPDLAIKELLNGNIIFQKSESEFSDVKVYAQGERPNTGLASEFVEVLVNGIVRSVTKPLGFLKGNLALAVYVKTYDDGSVFQYRVDSILKQIEELVSNSKVGDYFFEIDADNIITPTTVNVTTGYSTTILNIEWHTA